MFSFECDSLQGAHPKVLEALCKTNMISQPGYGADMWWKSATEKIKAAFSAPDHDVYLLTGGTQTNALIIDSLTRPYEGVISADTGHINVHEAGAVEHTGHKVLALPHHDGKLDAADVKAYLETFYADGTWTHMVKPGMVYVSHPTEYGTLYTADELRALSAVCKEYDMPLFLDGARLGYGLASNDTDVTPALLAELCDVFYVGGTKVGALCGEAVVFRPGLMPAQFATIVKQHGAMVAKGRLLGVQFDALMTDGTYEKYGCHQNAMADKLREGLKAKGVQLLCDTVTNQLFPVFTNEKVAQLEQQFGFHTWGAVGEDKMTIRLVTSWATKQEDVDAFLAAV